MMISRNIAAITLIAVCLMLISGLAPAQEFTFVCDDTIQTVNPEIEGNLFIPILTNVSGEPILVDLHLDTDNLGIWTATWCVGPSCYPQFVTDLVDTLAAGQTDSMDTHIVSYPDTLQVEGSITITATSRIDTTYSVAITFTATTLPLVVENPDPALRPSEFTLHPAFPNPFNPGTRFSYTSGQAEDVRIAVYNPLGQKVRTLFEGVQLPGTHTFIWDGKNDRGLDLPGAIYIITVDNGQVVRTVKTLKLK